MAMRTKMPRAVGLGTALLATTVEQDTSLLEPRQGWLHSWLPFLPTWSPSSPQQLQQAEHRLLGPLHTQSTGFYVNVGEINGVPVRVWTRRWGPPPGPAASPPLVMVHGMGAGLAMFLPNIGPLAKQRTVYAIDLPGFGRSSRPDFSSEPGEVEQQYVACLEQWRAEQGLGRIALLGHSFGGHLTALYALQHPANLHVAVLADPWGMTARPAELVPRRNFPLWARALGSVLQHFNPLAGLRAAGPAGPWLVTRMRPDIMRKYEESLGERTDLVAQYIFHCNAHSPSGETAFKRLMTGFGWADNPALPRLRDLDPSVRLRVLYGSESWMTHLTVDDFTAAGVAGEVEVNYIEGAGHHIYSDQPELFNTTLNKILEQLDC